MRANAPNNGCTAQHIYDNHYMIAALVGRRGKASPQVPQEPPQGHRGALLHGPCPAQPGSLQPALAAAPTAPAGAPTPPSSDLDLPPLPPLPTPVLIHHS